MFQYGSWMTTTTNYPNLSTKVTRHDGWTVDRQTRFLTALAASGCVREACAAAGMSYGSAYKLRSRPSATAFRMAWDAALDCAMSRLESAALSRAIDGVPRPIFHKGEQVGEWRYHDERLAMFLLRYRRPHRFGSQFDHLPPPAPLLLPSIDPNEQSPSDPDEAMAELDWHLDDLEDEPENPHAHEA